MKPFNLVVTIEYAAVHIHTRYLAKYIEVRQMIIHRTITKFMSFHTPSDSSYCHLPVSPTGNAQWSGKAIPTPLHMVSKLNDCLSCSSCAFVASVMTVRSGPWAHACSSAAEIPIEGAPNPNTILKLPRGTVGWPFSEYRVQSHRLQPCECCLEQDSSSHVVT